MNSESSVDLHGILPALISFSPLRVSMPLVQGVLVFLVFLPFLVCHMPGKPCFSVFVNAVSFMHLTLFTNIIHWSSDSTGINKPQAYHRYPTKVKALAYCTAELLKAPVLNVSLCQHSSCPQPSDVTLSLTPLCHCYVITRAKHFEP